MDRNLLSTIPAGVSAGFEDGGSPAWGLLGSQILSETATGAHGPGALINDSLTPGLLYVPVLISRSAETFVLYPNGSFEGPNPSTATYSLYEENTGLVGGSPAAILISSTSAGRSIWDGLIKRFRAPPLPKPGVQYAQAYMDNLVNILRLYFNQLDEYITAISKFAASGTAPPVSGTWAQGDVLRNSAPVELGTAGSRYVLTGWICVASGTPGTWRELRSLTGN